MGYFEPIRHDAPLYAAVAVYRWPGMSLLFSVMKDTGCCVKNTRGQIEVAAARTVSRLLDAAAGR
jgi:hypothetical protein